MSISDVHLKRCKAEAQRFLDAIQALQERRKSEPSAGLPTGCRESGAVNRASLDLTRALAAMRANR